MFEGIWQKSQHLALRRCKDMVGCLMETAKMHDKEKQGCFLPAVQRHATASALSAILRQASLEASLEISTSRFDSNPDLPGVENGVIELLTGLHRPACASDFFTLRCGAAYDPDAKCPEFTKFIASIAEGDTNFASYIQRALGYNAFPRTGVLLIIGPGGNGKGVLLRAITKALGDYGKTVAPSLLQRAYASNPNSPSPAVMALKGSLAGTPCANIASRSAERGGTFPHHP
ncbi:hypothetical protein [Pandoraea fibrosis]|uniref:hypothetical protein n=1 Tax=Pandoraea fibrosis TaxID=1891094 RepID=UPI000574BD7A|nr:hypothetical protein [Pandoraea fibrosis]